MLHCIIWYNMICKPASHTGKRQSGSFSNQPRTGRDWGFDLSRFLAREILYTTTS